jgi:predicted RNA binding protein YcfA (HicA-like mRNA interferase family)
MASVEKLVDKMRRQPRNISYDEAAKVLNHYGYELKRKGGTSHRVYANKEGDVFVLKDTNPLKISYIIEILERLAGE